MKETCIFTVALSESSVNKSQSQMEVQQTSSASRYKTGSTKGSTCKGTCIIIIYAEIYYFCLYYYSY